MSGVNLRTDHDRKARNAARERERYRKRKAELAYEPKAAGYLDRTAPDKPTQKPQDALRGIVYGKPRPPSSGAPANGNAMARAVNSAVVLYRRKDE